MYDHSNAHTARQHWDGGYGLQKFQVTCGWTLGACFGEDLGDVLHTVLEPAA